MTMHSQVDNLQINITLAALPPKLAGFGIGLLIAPAANNQTNNRVIRYEEVGNTNVGIPADWTTQEVNAAQAYFSQNPEPEALLIGEIDLNGGETYPQALDAIIQQNSNFYAVALTSRTDSDQETVSSDIESRDKRMIGFFQSSEADIVTGTLPGGTNFGSAYDTRERSFGIYHTDDTEWADMAWMARILPYDQDQFSPPFFANISGVAAYGSLPMGSGFGSQQSPSNVRSNNWNHQGPFRAASPAWVAPGTNFAGRQGKVIITRDWLYDRIQSDVAQAIVNARNQGRGIPVGEAGTSETVGQKKMESIIRGRYQQGADNGHFLPDNIEFSYPTVTSNQVASGIIPVDAEMTVEIAGQAVTFNLNMSRDPV